MSPAESEKLINEIQEKLDELFYTLPIEKRGRCEAATDMVNELRE